MSKRLLLVLPASTMGGAETLSKTLVAGLEDITTTVVTQEAIAERFMADAARVRVFEDSKLNAPYDYSPMNALRYAACITKIVAEERPDAVLSIMQAASISLAISAITHSHLFNGIRCVGSIHGHVGQYFRMLGRPPTLAERFYLWLIAARLDSIIVPSQGVRDDLATLVGASRNKSQAIYNGIDLRSVEVLSQAFYVPSRRRYRLVMAARLSPQKDHATLLKAFSSLPASHSAELVLLGEGEERASLQALAYALGISDSVVFAGAVKNPYPMIASADVVVLSSHFEGFGLAIVEALALGRAVVATDCPSGPAEIIRDGIDGYLVPPGNAKLLCKKLEYLLDNKELRGRLGRQGKERAKYFSRDKMIESYRSILFD